MCLQQTNMMGKLILVDEEDKIIGFEEKEKCHDGNGLLHRAFSTFIFNDKKELLIQKRSKLKRLWPLFWSNTCCSHPRFIDNPTNKVTSKKGFSIYQNKSIFQIRSIKYKKCFCFPTLTKSDTINGVGYNEGLIEDSKKRLKQECGIYCELKKLYKFQYFAKYKNEGSENEICSVLIGRLDPWQNIIPNKKEIEDFKWINIQELKKDIEENPDNYTPWFKMECKVIFSDYLDEIEGLFLDRL